MTKLRSIFGMYLALLFTAIAMMSCTTKGLDYEAGLRHFEAREFDEAIKIFEELAQGGGKYTNRARYSIGECYKFRSEWDKAMEQFQMVADAEPPTSYLGSEARNRISQIREGKRDVERLEITHKNYPGTIQAADALLQLGSVYENKMGDYNRAIKTYNQLIKEFPGTPKAAQAQINIGYIYFYKLYDHVAGWPEFQKVNEENYPELKSRVSEVEDLLRDTNKLLNEIRDHRAFIDKAQKRKIVPGRKVIGRDIFGARQDQVAQSFVAIGKKWRQLRNYPRAIAAYRRLIELLPLLQHQAAEARYGIAEIYHLDLGQYFDAIDAYEEYIKYHPTHFRRHEAIYNMAICYGSLRQYAKEYEMYKTYRDTYPEGKFYKAAELKVRQYEYDEDQDGFAYYLEREAGTSDTDPNQHP